MKNLGVILAVGITAVIVMTIGIFNFLLVSEAESAANSEEVADLVEETTDVPQMAAIQAAFEARETLLQAQIANLDAELADRQSAYDLQVEELSGLIVTGEEQLIQLQSQETILQEQIDALLNAQTERAVNTESQRQQAYYQYQVNVQQLQAQLDEANVRLNDAFSRLGQ